ncbi:MAG: FAD-dependent monooxygenase [Acidobacteria bacterium]|nr:FAD-dependent monooxygenase [Acidobacteriota bacterium]
MDADLATPGMTVNWDAVVVGAGPAGALSALLLARAGVRVLLVERKGFPRAKVCGGCLNAQALEVFERVGVIDRVRGLGGTPVQAIQLHHGSRVARIELPGGLAVSRSALDAELMRAAAEAGAHVVTETTGLVVPDGDAPAHEAPRRVLLRRAHGQETSVTARAVVVADGLAHSSLRDGPDTQSEVARHARIGVGALAPPGALPVARGAITMAVGRHGYVGAIEVEAGRINIAAALDAAFLRAYVSPGLAVATILRGAGLVTRSDVEGLEWLGTVPLTRRLRRPAARRVFVVGDAAGYVEPFTGEGMAWALAGAEGVVPLVRRAIEAWDEDLGRVWIDTHDRLVGREQRWCRFVAWAVRVPVGIAPLTALLGRYPWLARPVLSHLAPRAASHKD